MTDNQLFLEEFPADSIEFQGHEAELSDQEELDLKMLLKDEEKIILDALEKAQKEQNDG